MSQKERVNKEVEQLWKKFRELEKQNEELKTLLKRLRNYVASIEEK